MKNSKSRFLWIIVRSALISAVCTGAIFYIAGGARHIIPLIFAGFFATFIFAEFSTAIFDKIAKAKGLKVIFSLLFTAMMSIALAQVSSHVALIAAPFIFAFCFLGGFSILDKWLSVSDNSLADLIKPVHPHSNYDKIKPLYNHKQPKKFFDNTYANPVYRAIINSGRK